MKKIIREIIRPFQQFRMFLIIFYYKSKIKRRYRKEFFKDKRVAIIGGADSVLNKVNGDYIDSFDVVVRINNGVDLIQKQSQFVGSRTDVLFHSFCFSVDGNNKFNSEFKTDLWESNSINKLIFCHSLNSKFKSDFLKIRKFKTTIPYFYIDDKAYQNMLEILNGYIPTTGFVGIKTIIDSKPKEVFITGFTFFKTPFNKEYRDWSNEDYSTQLTNTHHNFDLEFEYLKNIYLNKNFNDYIKVDEPLKNLFIKQV